MRLTAHMRSALEEAQRQPLRRTHTPGPGQPPWPAPAVTLHALVRHGLLLVGELRNRHGYRVTVWTITDAGRDELAPVVAVFRDVPRFLARPSRNTGDYTTNPKRAIDDLEAVDPRTLERWHGDSAALHGATRAAADDHALAETTPAGRLRAVRELARSNRSIDLRDDLRVIAAELRSRGEVTPKIQRRIDAMERKVRRAA